MQINYKSVVGAYNVEVGDKWENLNIGYKALEYNGVRIHLHFDGESDDNIKVNRTDRIVHSPKELMDEFERIDAYERPT